MISVGHGVVGGGVEGRWVIEVSIVIENSFVLQLCVNCVCCCFNSCFKSYTELCFAAGKLCLMSGLLDDESGEGTVEWFSNSN